MADYLIQDTTLDAIADAINAKIGGSSAMTPAQMVTAIGNIPSGGGGEELTGMIEGTLTSLTDNNATHVRRHCFQEFTTIKSISLPNVTVAESNVFYQAYNLETLHLPKMQRVNGPFCFSECTKLTVLALPSFNSSTYTFAFRSDSLLEMVDLGQATNVEQQAFASCPKLKTLILRKEDTICTLSGANAFNSTPFASGGTGGTIYIPKALYDHLGDGTSLDYKAATNWSTFDGYGTITWAQIEGSIYETQYADGTPIPSE